MGSLSRQDDGVAGSAVIGPATEALDSDEGAVLVPIGLLAQLPLHAARSSGAGTLLDRLSVSYAPAAASYAAARTSALHFTSENAFVVADPSTDPKLSLPSAGYEAIAVRRAFAGALVLPGPQATRARVLKELKRRDLAHFACHGAADLFDPAKSFLLLANGEHLTLADFAPEQVAMRLVVLSACETGIGDVALPDDVVSFPAGLVELGAAGVIGSLWPVDDACTMTLMARFYEFWRTA